MKTRRSRKKWLILQYDDRSISKVSIDDAPVPATVDYTKLMEQNKKYAKRHGYAYKFVSKGYNKLPPYWRKVNLVKDLLKNYKGILWMDTDAVVFTPSKTLDSITNSSKMFFCSPDNYGTSTEHFNAGVWIIKNTPEMHDLMEDWLQLYNTKDWLKNSYQKWHTTGKWSNTTYEQGSFIETIRPSYKQYMKILPCNVLQGCLEDINTSTEPFIIHFMTPLKKHIPGFIKTFIDSPDK